MEDAGLMLMVPYSAPSAGTPTRQPSSPPGPKRYAIVVIRHGRGYWAGLARLRYGTAPAHQPTG